MSKQYCSLLHCSYTVLKWIRPFWLTVYTGYQRSLAPLLDSKLQYKDRSSLLGHTVVRYVFNICVIDYIILSVLVLLVQKRKLSVEPCGGY